MPVAHDPLLERTRHLRSDRVRSEGKGRGEQGRQGHPSSGPAPALPRVAQPEAMLRKGQVGDSGSDMGLKGRPASVLQGKSTL